VLPQVAVAGVHAAALKDNRISQQAFPPATVIGLGALPESAMLQTVEGTMATNGQKHFWMETNSTLGIPAKDGSLAVWTSTQDTCGSKRALVSLLNLDDTKVTVSNTQAGGGYGTPPTTKPLSPSCSVPLVLLTK
jgi:xanthine dehydrogenase molybdopterin-binding subunit B